jgi:hypothetical protein
MTTAGCEWKLTGKMQDNLRRCLSCDEVFLPDKYPWPGRDFSARQEDEACLALFELIAEGALEVACYVKGKPCLRITKPALLLLWRQTPVKNIPMWLFDKMAPES